MKRRMSARKPADSELDGDLVDPSFGAGATPEPAPTSVKAPPNPANVLVGGGEREARAYVGPTALPTVAAPKSMEGAGKVAIASSVDPRRMQTIKMSTHPGGRARPPLAPGERPPPPEGIPFGPVSPRPAPPPALVVPHNMPPSVHAPSRRDPTGSSATVIWVLAVVLAALIGAGAALWIRRNMAAQEAPAKPPVPAAPHS